MDNYDEYLRHGLDDYESESMCNYCDSDDFSEFNMKLDDGHFIKANNFFDFVDEVVDYLHKSNSDDAKAVLYGLLKYDFDKSWVKKAVDAIGRDTDDWEERYATKIFDWADRENAADVNLSPFEYVDEGSEGIHSTLVYSDYANEDGLIPCNDISWFLE